MKMKFFRTLVVLCLGFIVFSVPVTAQGIGTIEYEMRYGQEYFDARKYDMAIMYFENAIKKDPEHAAAHFLIGKSYIKLGKPEKARPFLEKAAQFDPDYGKEVEEMLAEIDGTTKKETVTTAKRTSTNAQTDEEIAEYEVGDAVEVSYAGQWNPGVIIKVEGRGESVRAEVDYTFQGDKRTAKFSYNALRRAAATLDSESKNAPKSTGGRLTLGEYGCSSKVRSGGQWIFTPRGSFRLQASGKYTQTSGGGSYKYDAETKEITFTGGFFGNSDAKGKVISSEQIDVEFDKNYWWTCALQK
jgi:tetratricopeptide (TPR) repeat protein